MKHVLSESALEQFGTMLEEFDAAVTQGANGRTAHTATTREMVVLTKEAGAVVRAMDARNRLRYQGDRQALEQWISVRTVLGSPQGRRRTARCRTGGAAGEWDAGRGRGCEARGMRRGEAGWGTEG